MKEQQRQWQVIHPYLCALRRAGDDDAAAGPSSEQSNGDGGRATVWLDGAKELLALLRTLGEAYRLLCMYKCREAADTFAKLPRQHYATGWVLCQVAQRADATLKGIEGSGSWANGEMLGGHTVLTTAGLCGLATFTSTRR
jgi:hypothetical protein